MIEMTECMRVVSLQFHSSNPKFAPPSITQLEPETHQRSLERKGRPKTGEMVGSAERCSLREIPETLLRADYQLVHAWAQMRVGENYRPGVGNWSRDRFYAVRFVFARKEFAKPVASFLQQQEKVWASLQEICRDAFWRMFMFVNPFREPSCEGEIVPQQQRVNVVLSRREPLFLPDGQPVLIWRRDERGRRVGDAPVPPPKPTHVLQMRKNFLELNVCT